MKIIEVKKPGEKKKRARALLLFSGGLDSILAGKVLEEQEIEIVALTFRSQFFGAGEAIRAIEELGWPLVLVDISREQIEIVENPRYGYGRQLNPCLDCHGQMVRIAGGLLERYQADFVATGEVVGERPKSQNRQALGLVEKLSGIRGLVLRPLSARLLPATIPEEKGLVDRERLLDISGRSRKRQLELAEKYGLKDYPTPAGGCLLTDPGFAARAKQLIKWRGRLLPEDIELIKTGRVFFEPDGLIVVGRNERENEKIAGIAGEADILVTTAGIKGPLACVRLKEAGPLSAGREAKSDRDREDGAAVAGEYFSEWRADQGSLIPPGQEGEGDRKGMALTRMVRQIQEGIRSVERQEPMNAKSNIPCQGAVHKACLLVIRYSRAREKERASAAIIHRGMVLELEFCQAHWKKYL
ncbi:MAG: tRNA 4-thiouridine(8) synthase ThiI [Candidatus Saccharicenans sp.]|nr:tRNA 4-thiouridine(8) synthase ThiI [Candidatus Saccharicenans sp.]